MADEEAAYQERTDVANMLLLRGSTTGALPLGITITLMVGGSFLVGRCLRPIQYAESLRDKLVSLLPEDQHKMSAALRAVDVSELVRENPDSLEVVAFDCDRMLTAAGVLLRIGAILRINRYAINAVVIGDPSFAEKT